MSTQTAMIVVGTTLMVVAAFWGGRLSRNDEVDRMARDLSYLRATHLVQSGWSQGFGSYYLVSVDGGQHWIALDPQTRAPIGPADPALLAHNAGMAALSEYVQTRGPIGSRPITDEDVAVLEGAGFGVHRADP